MSVNQKSTFLPCPKCGGDLNLVTDSRPCTTESVLLGVSLIKRRRICTTCNQRSNTFEITEDELPKAQNQQQKRALAHPEVQAVIGRLVANGAL